MERVGTFDVHEQLGRGGMGAVFRAVDGRTGQEVALKLLAATDERARRRLVLEARALARLRHRNVVALLDAGEDRGRPWIALELVRGRSLQERLDREGPLAPREAAELVRALAAGLAHAHREGVLHRDLKPANVMLPDDGGEPRLTDFGLAGFTFDLSQSRLTVSGTLMGSPGYWSPEQASGKASAIGPSTDVYGLGGVLYATLTGRPPVAGESLQEVLVATEARRPDAPRRDRALDAIAMRCLEKRPADRFASVDEVSRALARYLARRPGGAGRVVALVVGLAGVASLVALVAWPAAAPVRVAPTPSAAPIDAPSVAAIVTAPPSAAPIGAAPVVDEAARAEVERLLASAAERSRARDHRGAIEDLDRALALDPRCARAFHLRGNAWLTLDEPGRAVADHDRALELAPGVADVHRDRGVARTDLKDTAGAIADYDRAIDLEPGRAIDHVNRGNAKARLGDLEGALADFERAVELDPRLAPALRNRALARFNLGDHRGAIAAYDAALAVEPRNVEALRTRGLAKVKVGDSAGALADYDLALELAPRNADTYLKRGLARLNLDDDQGAIADYDRAVELGLRSAIVYSNRGTARRRLGELEAAVADYGLALEVDPRSALAYMNRGAVRAELGDDRGAVADCEEALRLEPDASWAAQTRKVLAEARARLAGP